MLMTGLEQLVEALRHPAATPLAVTAAEFDRHGNQVAALPLTTDEYCFEINLDGLRSRVLEDRRPRDVLLPTKVSPQQTRTVTRTAIVSPLYRLRSDCPPLFRP
jgi:hypothetical protein